MIDFIWNVGALIVNVAAIAIIFWWVKRNTRPDTFIEVIEGKLEKGQPYYRSVEHGLNTKRVDVTVFHGKHLSENISHLTRIPVEWSSYDPNVTQVGPFNFGVEPGEWVEIIVKPAA